MAKNFWEDDAVAKGDNAWWANDTVAGKKKEAPIPERSWSEVPTDLAASAVSGLGGLAQFPGQVYGLATGAIKDKDFAKTGLYGIGQEMQDYAKSLKSQGLLAKEAAAEAKTQEAAQKEGQLSAFTTGIAETVKDPALLSSFLLEQVPQAIPSMIAAMIPGIGPEAAAEIKNLQLAAKAATNAVVKKAAEDALEAAVKRGTQSAVERGSTAALRTAAVQQGADVGSGTYQAMQKRLVDQGMSEEQAANEVINYARAAGIGGGALSLLAAKLPGAQAFERALAGEKTGLGRLTGAVVGAAKETPGENVEEVGGRFLQNLAMKQINPEQSLTEGLGQTAAQATIGAAGLGALGGVRSGRPIEQAAPEVEKEAPPAEKPLALGLSEPFAPRVFPDGSVATTPEDIARYEEEQFKKKYAAQPADEKERLALGLSEPFVPRVFPDGSVATTPEDIKRYEEMQFEKKYAPQATLATAFSEASRRATRAQEAFREGLITKEQYDGYVAERDRLKELYNAEQDTPERMAQYTPEQQEALRIAKSIEDAGENGFAEAMRASVRSGNFRPDSLQFYRDKLSAFEARKAAAPEEGAPAKPIPKVEPETRNLTSYLSDNAGSMKRMQEHIEYAPQEVQDVIKKIDDHIQQVTATINNAGFKVNDVNSATAPANVRDLKNILSGLSGIGSRILMEAERIGKNHKNANPEKMAKALASANEDIALAQARMSAFPKPEMQVNQAEAAPEADYITDLTRDLNMMEQQRRAIKGVNLFSRIGKFGLSDEDFNEIKDLPNFAKASKERGATSLTDRVANGEFDNFLPFNNRHDNPNFDLETAEETIKDAIRTFKGKDSVYYDYETQMQLDQMAGEIERIEKEIRNERDIESINREIELIADELAANNARNREAEDFGVEQESAVSGAPETQEGTEQVSEAKQDVPFTEKPAEEGDAEVLSAVSADGTYYYTTDENRRIEKELTGKTMAQAAKWAVDNAPNAFAKHFAQKAYDRIKDMERAGVRFGFSIATGNTRPANLSSANGVTNYIWGDKAKGEDTAINIQLNGATNIDKQTNFPPGCTYIILLHELLHVAARGQTRFLRNSDPLVKELNDLYGIIAKKYNADRAAGNLPEGIATDYNKGRNNAFASSDELISWGLTDERMQKYLSEIKVGEKTAFGKLIELIRKILGIAKPFETALDRLVRTTDQILDISVEEIANGAKAEGYSFGRGKLRATTGAQQSLFSKAVRESLASKQKIVPQSTGKEALDVLERMGRKAEKPNESYIQKARKSWDNALDNPKTTMEAALTAVKRFNDRVQTWSFSSDAALNNNIRSEIMQSNMDSKEKIGTLLNVSLSQTVHADALASLLMTEGNLKYDEKMHKWVAVKDDANFVALSKALDELAAKHGLNKEMADTIAHTAFEARRLKSMVEFNGQIRKEVADMRAEATALRKRGSPVAASALFEKATNRLKEEKFIHMTDEQINEGNSLFKLMPELTKVSDIWNQMRENTANILVETGLWSREEAEFMLDNADYVPFFREEQIEEGKGPKEYIRGLMVQAKEKKLKGSAKPVNDVFDNMARWMQYSVNRAVRNRSALALVDTAVQVGAASKIKDQFNSENIGISGITFKNGAKPFATPKQASKFREDNDLKSYSVLTAIDKDGNNIGYYLTPNIEEKNVVKVWRNGKQVEYSMADPMFVEAFTGLESIAIPTWKWASKLSNMLRQSVVMYPLFSVAQLPQDSFAAMFSSGLKAQYALRIPALAVKEFLRTITKTSKTHEELKSYGVVGVRDFTSSMARLDAEVYAGLKAPPGFVGKLKGALSHIAMASDNAVRQATYEAAMAQGLSRAEAIEKAFEIWNVRRKGTSKSLAIAGQVIPFFSAYLAAQNVALKTISGTGTSPTERSEAIKTLAGTTASVMVLSLLYAMINGDDDDYLKKPAVVRDRLLMIPGTGGLSIPIRADLFSIPKIVTEHMYLMMTDKGYEDGRKFRDSMAAVLKASLFSPTVVPQAFKPLVEIGINYDFYSGRPLVGHFEKMKETERQFTDTTSELAKLMGSTGIMSPIAIDHILRGMFGSVGGLTIYMTNPLLHSDPNIERPTMSWKDAAAALPGTSGFVSREYESGLKNDFYVLRDEVAKVANTMSDLKQKNPEQIEKYLSSEEIMNRYGMAKGVGKITDQLGKIRKNISQITNAPKDVMTGDEKKAMIKELRAAETDMLKAINTKELRAMAKL